MDDQEILERRKFPRYTHDLPVTYQTLAADLALSCPHCGGELIVAGRSLDQLLIQGTGRTQTLSLGGMAIEVDRSFAPGKQMLLQFSLSGEMIATRATVVMSQRTGNGVFRVGVEFLDLSEDARQVLVDYFADCLLREARDRSLLQHIVEPEDEPTDIKRREAY